MPGQDARPQVDAKMYLALGRPLAERLDAAVGRVWAQTGTLTAADAQVIMDVMFADVEGAPAQDAEGIDARLVRECLDTLLKRQGIPTSQESAELLAADAAQDAANQVTGLITGLAELEHRRDTTMTQREQAAWQSEYNRMQSTLSTLPLAVAEQVREGARQALANRH